MQADTRGLKEAEKFLKANPATSRAAFLAAGRELAEKLYKKEVTRERFTKCWEYEAKFFVFCADRQLAARIAYDLNAINYYHSEKKRDEEMHGRWLSADRDRKLWAAKEAAWADLMEIGLPHDAYYSDDNNNLYVREIIISAPETDQPAADQETAASSAPADQGQPEATTKVTKAAVLELAKSVNAEIAVNGVGAHKYCYTGAYNANSQIRVYDNEANLQVTTNGASWHDSYQFYHLLTSDGTIHLFTRLDALAIWLTGMKATSSGDQGRAKPDHCDWCKRPTAPANLHVIGFNPRPGEEVYVCDICLDEKRRAYGAYDQPDASASEADDQGAELIAGLLVSSETHYAIVPDRYVSNCWHIRTMNIAEARLSWLAGEGPASLDCIKTPEEARMLARQTFPHGLELRPEAFVKVWRKAFGERLTPDYLMTEAIEASGDLDDSPLVTPTNPASTDGLIY